MKALHSHFIMPLMLLALLAIAVAGCTTQGSDMSQQQAAPEVRTVVTATARTEVAAYTLKLPGQLEPFSEVALYAKVSGFVENLYVDRGSRVRKGQLLARLDAPEISQRYAAAAAKQREVLERMRYSGQAYQRLLQASQSAGAVAALELEQAKANLMRDSAAYESAQAALAAERQLTRYLEIRAPFNGIVTERTVSPGALVASEDAVFRMAEQDRLRLVVAIPEKHAHAISDDTRVQYRVNSHPNEVFTARLSRNSGVVDSKLRALIVEFDIDNSAGRLNGGEYIEAELSMKRKNPSLWVPSTSILETPSGTFVFRVENDTLRQTAVKTGLTKEGLSEVYGDLAADDTVVAEGVRDLREGMKIATSSSRLITRTQTTAK